MPKRVESDVIRSLQGLRSRLSKLIARQRDMERAAKVALDSTVDRKAQLRDTEWQMVAAQAQAILIDEFRAAFQPPANQARTPKPRRP